ncbi:hypothetical protein DFS33DRAFT_820978 [Desarmillaria ectypa]|nr:hypothetical protein DFS33DRAFT_820978 [Desarmillaria ectypa]
MAHSPGGRPRKKRKPSEATIHDDSEYQPTKRLCRRKPSLCMMMELPEDIVLEICAFLEPSDLLHLARVSKAFRALLMSRTSRGAWKSARTNIPGLPDPFPGMSEPAWACLAFISECTVQHNNTPFLVYSLTFLPQFCSNTVRIPDFLLRSRICSACLDAKVVGRKELRLPLRRVLSDQPSVFDLLLSVRTNFRGNKPTDRYCLKTEWNDINSRISTLTADQEKRKFIEDKLVQLARFNQHAALCDAWYKQHLYLREKGAQKARSERVEAIHAKLRELGYLKLYMCDISKHPHVDRMAPLTDRGWARIRDDMVFFAELVMETKERVEQERLERNREAVRRFHGQTRRPIEVSFEDAEVMQAMQALTFSAGFLGLALLATSLTAAGILGQVWAR